MNGSVLNKYAVGKQSEAAAKAPADADALDDLGAFGCLRGIHDRAIMLELRHADGKVSAFGYAWLSQAEFDPSEGITLSFGGNTVKITGRHLNAEVRSNVRLFAAIVRHRVPWIQESDGPTQLAATKGTIVIEGIEVK